MHEPFIQDGFWKCIECLLQAAPFLPFSQAKMAISCVKKNRVQVTVRVEWKELLEFHILKKKHPHSCMACFHPQSPYTWCEIWENYVWFTYPSCTVSKWCIQLLVGKILLCCPNTPCNRACHRLACASTTRGGIPGKLHQDYEENETTEWGKHSAILCYFLSSFNLETLLSMSFLFVLSLWVSWNGANDVGCSTGVRYIAPGFWLARCCVQYDLT